jgi:hypothetical protein
MHGDVRFCEPHRYGHQIGRSKNAEFMSCLCRGRVPLATVPLQGVKLGQRQRRSDSSSFHISCNFINALPVKIPAD